MKQEVIDFVEEKNIAVVGVSRSGKKFGNTIYTELKGRGYQVYIVHPEAQEINGEPCYPNLAALKGKAGGVVVCVTPQQAGSVLREAAEAGFKKVWLQMGADSPDVLAQAAELGIQPVTGRCILMYAQPVGSFHAWHRAFAKLFGQL
jgi:uncharacterized protein